MLNKLIESKYRNKENRKLRGLLIATSTLAFSGVIFALIFSLFSQNLAMGGESIDLSSLIAPPKIVEDKPAPPEPTKKTEKTTKKNVKSDVPTRTQNILRLDESPQKVPNKVSTKPTANKARPNSNFTIGAVDIDPTVTASNFSNKNVAGETNGTPMSDMTPNEIEEPKNEAKKPIKKKAPPPLKKTESKPKNVVVSKGVINGKAKNLVMPSYPAAAKSAGISGKVTIQVLINEDGKVISAKAVGGHPLLTGNAVIAARKSTFTPTFLSNDKVKVSGMIIYNFK